MFSFRRIALLPALGFLAIIAVQAQTSSSFSFAPSQDQIPTASQAAEPNEAPQTAAETQGQASVQARIRLRREQRRATAIHDAYDHRWESYIDMGYLRFTPGPNLQRLTYYAWESGLTRFSSARLGYILDARGYGGTTYVGQNFSNNTRYKISQYDLLFGPVYRFYVLPRYAISGRVMAGGAYGNFSGDTNGIPPSLLGLYPDALTYAASASIIGEYNLGPGLGFKLAPEYFFTGFGSTVQASRGFTAGIVYRFGKQ